MTEVRRNIHLFGKQILGDRSVEFDTYDDQAQLGEVPPGFVPVQHLVDSPDAIERISKHAQKTGRKVEFLKGAAGRVTAYVGEHKYEAAVIVGAAALATFLATKEVRKRKRE